MSLEPSPVAQPSGQTEPYWTGVRRRVRSGSILAALSVFECAVLYGTFAASGSVRLTFLVALLAGVVMERVDLSWDPLTLKPGPSAGDKRQWLMLFAPALLVLAGLTTYFLARPPQGTEAIGAILLASLLGFLISATLRLTTMKADQS